MQKTRINKLIKQFVLPCLSEFKQKGSLLYHKDTSKFIKGIYIEPSRMSKTQIAVWYFAQPLYIYAENLVFNFGNRFSDKNEKWWDFDKDDSHTIMSDIVQRIKNTGLPYFQLINSPNSFAENCLGNEADLHYLNSILYSNIFEGVEKEVVFSNFATLFDKANEYGLHISWIASLLDKAERLKEIYLKNDAEAKVLLEENIRRTKEKLGIS